MLRRRLGGHGRRGRSWCGKVASEGSAQTQLETSLPHSRDRWLHLATQSLSSKAEAKNRTKDKRGQEKS